MPDTLPHLILGIVCFLYGASAIARNAITIHIGKTSSPHNRIELQDTPAIILGVFILITGFIIALPFILSLFGNTLTLDWLLGLPIAGGVIFIVGCLLSISLQMALWAGDDIKKSREKSSNRAGKN